MSNLNPVVLIDSREQLPLPITAYETEIVGLPCGDYSIRGFGTWDNPRFCVERKSLCDLVSSLTQGRARFERELQKMRQFEFAAILIEGYERQVADGDYQSMAEPEALLQSLAAFEARWGIHVCWAGTRTNAARVLERWVRQFCKGVEKDHKRLLMACEQPEPAAAN